MTKAVSVLAILLMAIQIIKPLGLPGLTRRGDFWKLALFAFGALILTIGLREGWEALAS